MKRTPKLLILAVKDDSWPLFLKYFVHHGPMRHSFLLKPISLAFQGGWTYTDKALDLARTRMFNEYYGSRKGAPKVKRADFNHGFAGYKMKLDCIKECCKSFLFKQTGRLG